MTIYAKIPKRKNKVKDILAARGADIVQKNNDEHTAPSRKMNRPVLNSNGCLPASVGFSGLSALSSRRRYLWKSSHFFVKN
jgi:phosphopantothenate synthetase